MGHGWNKTDFALAFGTLCLYALAFYIAERFTP